MQHYLIVWSFPTVEGAWESCPGFADYINSGGPGDKFDGFELLFRVHAPGEGRVVVLCRAESDKQLFAHFAPWRAQFGMVIDFTPVISCQNVVDYHKDLFAKLGG